MAGGGRGRQGGGRFGVGVSGVWLFSGKGLVRAVDGIEDGDECLVVFFELVGGVVEGGEDAFEGAAALAAAAAFGAGDVEEELEGFGVLGDDVKEALALPGVAAVFVGVEVADWGAGAGAGAASGHWWLPF